MDTDGNIKGLQDAVCELAAVKGEIAMCMAMGQPATELHMKRLDAVLAWLASIR